MFRADTIRDRDLPPDRRKGLRALVLAAILAIGWVVPNHAKASENECAQISVSITAEGMSASEASRFENEFHAALRKVCAWWGPTFKGPISARVEDSRGPSMALVPAWRGKHGSILFRTRRTLNGRSPLVHELTHVFAPNANRFLAEGLAVYAEEHLSERITYPAFGKDIHEAAKAFAATVDLELLEKIPTPRRLQIEGRIEQREAYTVGGSFVRFLIETGGLEKFRSLYAMTPMVPGERTESDRERWQTVYGHSFDDLVERWRAYVTTR